MVGSYLSGHTVLMYSCPVVRVNATLQAYAVVHQPKQRKLKFCFSYSGYKVPSSISRYYTLRVIYKFNILLYKGQVSID